LGENFFDELGGFGFWWVDGGGGDDELAEELAGGVVEVEEAAAGALVDAEEGGEVVVDEGIEVGAFFDAAFFFSAVAEVPEDAEEGVVDLAVAGDWWLGLGERIELGELLHFDGGALGDFEELDVGGLVAGGGDDFRDF